MGWREDNADINEKIYRIRMSGMLLRMRMERRELADMEFRSWLMWERYKMALRRERLEMRSPESGKTQPRNNKGQYKKYKTDGSGNGENAADSTGAMNTATPNTIQQNIGGIKRNSVLTGGENGGIIVNKDSSFDYYSVSKEALSTKLTVDAFADPNLNESISVGMHDVLAAVKDHVPGTEAGLVIPVGGGNRSDTVLGGEGEGTIMLPKMSEPYVSIHNHASGQTLSSDDFSELIKSGNQKGAFVIGNNGNIYGIVKNDDYDWLKFGFMSIDKSYDEIIKDIIGGDQSYGFTYYQRIFE